MKRLIYGSLCLFLAFLLCQAASFGRIGLLLARTTHNLVGAAGVAFLTVALLCAAFTLIVPRSVRRWLFALPGAVSRASADPRPATQPIRAPRRAAAPRQQIIVVTGAELQGAGLRALLTAAQGAPDPDPARMYAELRGMTEDELRAYQRRSAAGAQNAYAATGPQHSARWEQVAPTAPIDVPDGGLTPTERMRLDDVRGALKQLGYRPHEYAFVGSMDPTQPFETLVRDALKKLRVATS